MKDFFGFGGYQRPVEGYFSWQHIVFASTMILWMIALAVIIGRAQKDKPFVNKNRVIIISAIVIDIVELFRIVLLCFRSGDPMDWVNNLPLFLCSIQFITIPLAAFARGRLKETALDFVMIFGILGGIIGIFFAGNTYSTYPIISFDNITAGITHAISGFVSLYIMFSRMISMRKKNIVVSYTILIAFCIAAWVANRFVDCNYMFLTRGDGTPYTIFYNLVNGNQVLYPLIVVLLFLIYITAFYGAYFYISKVSERKKTKQPADSIKSR